MRVVAGELGGRKLLSPPGDETRPTTDRVREAIFNTLYSLDAVEGANVLDAFAGSGALGIEALSRGAAHVTFCERARPTLQTLRDNIATLDVGARSTVVPGDALTHLARNTDGYDLVLLDPPYLFDQWDELIGAVNHDALLVIESGRELALPSPWTAQRVKRYGGTVVTLATRGKSA